MRTLLKSFFVVAGLLAQAPAVDTAVLRPLHYGEDPRLVQLRKFFLKYDSPVHYLAVDFLEAADENGLDWRLLPTIAMVESGGGRSHTKNNIFGWASCRRGFPSVHEGIHTVASRLANSRLYRGKDLEDILRTYNRRKAYGHTVLILMKTLGPVETPAGDSVN
ncbi:MAG: hypothetical protein NT090_10235 [Acidobacteria bacterium]|nr:hypothetical protein [Acidobacteriota bacterium]